MNKLYAPLAVSLAATLVSANAQASDWLLWQDNSISYLAGKGFKVHPDHQQTITFEHANAWKYGDNFFFIDLTRFNGKKGQNLGKTVHYGELSSRLSAGKIFDRPFTLGPIKDVLLAMTYEFGEKDVEAYLIGPAVDLNVPGFDYLSLNFYRRYNEGSNDGSNVWQITPTWAITIPVGRSDILFDGYMDWVTDNDRGYHSNLHFNPQVKYDLGKAMGWSAKQLYVGIEYSYWKDKFGIEDTRAFHTNQSATSALVKLHF